MFPGYSIRWKTREPGVMGLGGDVFALTLMARDLVSISALFAALQIFCMDLYISSGTEPV